MKLSNNVIILSASLCCVSTYNYADTTAATLTQPAKYTPFTTVYFAPRTQYRTASKGFLQRLMLTGVVQESDSILKNMYWSFETDADLGKHMDQWKDSYQEVELNI